ncbi:MAG: prolipoprotein diacylglyceryl transferase [Lachnospiraceae bacterium]|nr:prolipoprotein diacylglyceryl transferase [Lachnospiraceae bacterium]
MVYLFFSVLSFAITLHFIYYNVKNKYNYNQCIFICFCLCVGGYIGAKLLGIFVMVYRNRLCTIKELLLYGDMVYYGGLYGALNSGIILVKINFISSEFYKKYIICSIPLFHTISRCGCFFSGCCYGKTLGNVKIPVQLLESMCELIIFFIIFYMDEKINKLVCYFVMYGIARFCLEFLRGDIERGIIYGISISQWLSIINIIVCLIWYLSKKLENKNVKKYN